MAEKIEMIALSPTMESGTIINWVKKEGDSFVSGDVICEVETDKAAMDYEAFTNGTILKIVVPEGDKASIGEVIAVSGEKNEDISALLADIETGRGKNKTVNGEDSSGRTGAETDKTAGAVTAPETGIAVKADIAAETKTGSDKPVDKKAAGSAGLTGLAGLAEPKKERRIKASPLARVIAKRERIELSSVKGSGPEGRIIKRDLEGFTARAGRIDQAGRASWVAQTGRARRGDRVSQADRPDRAKSAESGGGLKGETVRVSGMRKAIAERLAESKFSAPHYYLKVTVNAERLLAAREKLNKKLAEKVSLNAFLLKISAEVLVKHPVVNSSWQGESIKRFGSCDIGLAVALDDGLITPVIRGCEHKGIMTIDRELKNLVRKAKEGKLAPSEYSNATFTISNLGSFGIEEFTAIINPPGSAILAVGEIVRQPVAAGRESEGTERINIIPAVKLTLSCDHRVIDGAAGAAFLHDLKECIEEPYNILF
ncbi:MAG: 2-oxo acid dehydrogenase subunit E2 [Spirochaetes bacterium]|nr:2-oxo acid dehydrogenase subunit E2 [Spirochaetota bacterium]